MLQPGDTIVVEGGQTVRLEKPLKSGRGGEGVVFDVSVRSLVAKIYHTPPGPDLVAKLACMIANPPDDPERATGHAEIAWPLGRAMYSGKVVGFLMPKAPPGRQLVSLLNPKTRKDWMPQFTWQGMLLAARNLADAFQHIHAKGYVVGDVKPENIHVTEQSLVTILDTDSFQVQDEEKGVIYPCGVATPGYTAPELLQGNLRGQPRRPEQDAFALGVIIFKLLAATNAHPYQGMWVGMGDAPDSDDELVLHGWYTFRAGSLMRPNPRIMQMSAFPPDVVALWDRCFVQGHFSPSSRPTAQEWFKVLDKIVNNNDILARCSVVPWHIHYRDVECPWCALAKTQGVNYFPGPLPSPQPVPPAAVPPAPRVGTNRRAPIVPPPPPWPPPQPLFKLMPQPGGAAQPPQPVLVADAGMPQQFSFIRRRLAALIVIAVTAVLLVGTAFLPARRIKPGESIPTNEVKFPYEARQPGDLWSNSIGMQMIYVPPNEVRTSSPTTQATDARHPSPEIRPLLVSRTEVTRRQYREIMGGDPPSFFNGSDDLPMESVSWDQARKFCDKLGQKEGRSYRLPYEAEWEYACRAGSPRADGGIGELDKTTWYNANAGNKTHEVGARRANAWGLYDMHGNVAEWCHDRYAPYAQEDQRHSDVLTPDEEKVPGPNDDCVVRGGSWYDDPEKCSASSRAAYRQSTQMNRIGFRIVLEHPDKTDR